MTPSAVSRKASASPWWVWAILLGLVAGAVWLLVRWAIRDPRAFAGYTLGFVALGELGVLIATSPRVRAVVERGFDTYWWATGWMMAAVLPAFIARWLSEVVAASPLAVGVALLAMYFGVFCLCVRPLSNEHGRERLWTSLSIRGGWSGTAASSTSVVFTPLGYEPSSKSARARIPSRGSHGRR